MHFKPRKSAKKTTWWAQRPYRISIPTINRVTKILLICSLLRVEVKYRPRITTKLSNCSHKSWTSMIPIRYRLFSIELWHTLIKEIYNWPSASSGKWSSRLMQDCSYNKESKFNQKNWYKSHSLHSQIILPPCTFLYSFAPVY